MDRSCEDVIKGAIQELAGLDHPPAYGDKLSDLHMDETDIADFAHLVEHQFPGLSIPRDALSPDMTVNQVLFLVTKLLYGR